MAKKDKNPDPDFTQDLLLREVDEDVRAERLSQWWQRFGSWLVGGAVVIILATVGYEMRHTMQEEKAEEATAVLLNAAQLKEAGKNTEALATLQKQTDMPKDTAALAALQTAAIAQTEGNEQAAKTAFESTAKNSKNAALKSFSRLHLAQYDVIDTKQPFYATAQELKAATLYEQGDKEAAQKTLNDLLLDPALIPSLRKRIEELQQAYK